MKYTGIIMSGDHPLKCMDGAKTMARRVIKPQPRPHLGYMYFSQGKAIQCGVDYPDTKEDEVNCPYGQVGDRLWVRETFCHKVDPITAQVSYDEYWYRATNPEIVKVDGDGGIELTKAGYEASPWIPSIHMPRRASRITLEITEVRVERVQEITYKDCYAEGISRDAPNERRINNFITQLTPITHFKELWNSLNAKRGYGWEVNPWVWCVSFRRIT